MSMVEYLLVYKIKYKLMKDLNHPSNWKYTSPEEEGFFEIVTPNNSACKITWIYRLHKLHFISPVASPESLNMYILFQLVIV